VVDMMGPQRWESGRVRLRGFTCVLRCGPSNGPEATPSSTRGRGTQWCVGDSGRSERRPSSPAGVTESATHSTTHDSATGNHHAGSPVRLQGGQRACVVSHAPDYDRTCRYASNREGRRRSARMYVADRSVPQRQGGGARAHTFVVYGAKLLARSRHMCFDVVEAFSEALR